MYPFIHLGHFSIGTFGLCLWLASVCACWTLYCNFRRYGIDADAVGVAAYTTVGGVAGAKLWHVLEDPTLLIHQPALVLFDRAGFAWFGGLLAGIAVLLWQGRQAKTGGLGMLDLAAPAVSVGYGVGRIGCLVSGDGDYGIPTHHYVPVFHSVIASACTPWSIWKMRLGPLTKQAAAPRYLRGECVARPSEGGSQLLQNTPNKSNGWASPIFFVPRIRISCTGRHQHLRVRLSLRKAA